MSASTLATAEYSKAAVREEEVVGTRAEIVLALEEIYLL